MRWKIATLLCVALCGCTIVHIEGGQSVSSVHLGVLRIEPMPGAELLLVRTEGIGVTPSMDGVHLGYMNQTVAAAYNGSRCQVIIFAMPRREQDAAHLVRLLVGVPHVCQVEGGNHENIEH